MLRHFSSSAKLLSKIGQTPIKFPSELQYTIQSCAPPENLPKCDRELKIFTPDCELRLHIHPFVEIKKKYNLLEIKVSNPADKHQKAMWGTSRALIARMVQGLTEGFTLPLRMVGVGYRALIEEGKLSLKVGVSHPVLMEIPKGITVSIPAPQRIILTGNNWPRITQFASEIREWRKPEPYNQKGIFVGDETIKKKEGKKR
jgi:large subunit ribosomal protein L6